MFTPSPLTSSRQEVGEAGTETWGEVMGGVTVAVEEGEGEEEEGKADMEEGEEERGVQLTTTAGYQMPSCMGMTLTRVLTAGTVPLADGRLHEGGGGALAEGRRQEREGAA